MRGALHERDLAPRGVGQLGQKISEWRVQVEAVSPRQEEQGTGRQRLGERGQVVAQVRLYGLATDAP